jgi:cytochrome P450
MPEVGVPSIATADDSNHARHRKLLAHAFSERALRDQEPILKQYTDLLVSKLSERSAAGDQVDLTEWYNFIAFDIVADLSFGEPFRNLEKQENHPWVKAVEADMKLAVQLSQTYAITSLSTIVNLILPLLVGSKHHLAYQFSQIKTTERLDSGSGRPDFMTHILRHNDEKGLSRQEIDADVSTLINAGSETTSTVLSGCTYFLLKNLDVLQCLTDEIRGTFKTIEGITSAALSELPYLTAVLEETLRLYPPLPVALPRVVPAGGGEISGYRVPAGVSHEIQEPVTTVHTDFRPDCCRNTAAGCKSLPDQLHRTHVIQAKSMA